MKLSFSRPGFKPDNFRLFPALALVEVYQQYGQRLDGSVHVQQDAMQKVFAFLSFPSVYLLILPLQTLLLPTSLSSLSLLQSGLKFWPQS